MNDFGINQLYKITIEKIVEIYRKGGFNVQNTESNVVVNNKDGQIMTIVFKPDGITFQETQPDGNPGSTATITRQGRYSYRKISFGKSRILLEAVHRVMWALYDAEDELMKAKTEVKIP